MFKIFRELGGTESECKICGSKSILISRGVGVCLGCIRDKPEEALVYTSMKHAESKRYYNAPSQPPKKGVNCGFCVNRCKIPSEEKGYCGIVTNVKGKLVRLAGTPEKGLLSWYYDPLPTNCVADWVCPGGTGAGYPKYAYCSGSEYGYANLAVFFGGCTFDCLFCQNWHFRENTKELKPLMSSEELAGKAKDNVSCVCFFGGDPTPQMPHALEAAEIATRKATEEARIFRVCWETNGSMNWNLARRAMELSLKSGGCMKFDLKCFDENLNTALCGVSNEYTLQNFERLGQMIDARPEPPPLVASTLLIPGYIDKDEVQRIAEFIAGIDPNIPYALLGFFPHYFMRDLPATSRNHAHECLEAAKKAGLKKVRIGNVHLLSSAY
ncbi:MAG: radical SAM protein [Candidatus Hodarchaeota archaeon]